MRIKRYVDYRLYRLRGKCLLLMSDEESTIKERPRLSVVRLPSSLSVTLLPSQEEYKNKAIKWRRLVKWRKMQVVRGGDVDEMVRRVC